MVVIKAHFDGKQVVVGDEIQGLPPGEVILIFENGHGDPSDTEAWMHAQESAFAKAWDNDEDAIYDSL